MHARRITQKQQKVTALCPGSGFISYLPRQVLITYHWPHVPSHSSSTNIGSIWGGILGQWWNRLCKFRSGLIPCWRMWNLRSLAQSSGAYLGIDHICVHRYNGIGRLFIKAMSIDGLCTVRNRRFRSRFGYWRLRLATPPEETILPLWPTCDPALITVPCSYF